MAGNGGNALRMFAPLLPVLELRRSRYKGSIMRLRHRIAVYASLVAIILTFVTFDVADRLWSDGPPFGIPAELAGVWEVYRILDEDYAGFAELDQNMLSTGAIQGMLDILTANGTDGQYPQTALDPSGFEAVWQAWQDISDNLDGDNEVTPEILEEAAIRGMLNALGDPNTSYLSPEGYKQVVESYESDFEGIGAWVREQNGRITVQAVMDGTPAYDAGLLSGDVLLEVDGQPIDGFSVDEAVAIIRGPRGSTVELLVLHPEEETPEKISITRASIRTPSAGWRPLNEEIAYLWIDRFRDETDKEVEEALVEIVREGYSGLVLDVRGNLGGILSVTVSIASLFLEDGLVLYQVDGQGVRTDMEVSGGGIATEVPLVILVDEASASSSEVLAGAFQDHGRAVVIGTTTFGKGSVNELKELDSGSALYVTAALWYTPNGRLIEGEGLQPDITSSAERWATFDPAIAEQLGSNAIVTVTRRGNGLFEVLVDRPLLAALEQLQPSYTPPLTIG